ncbi:MAG: hypothetical protein EXR72_24510 [Myxococcales bacterium]|nr:hypothetical protein [Myxococcales bacterium]
MNWLGRFWRQPNRRYRNFQIVFTLLTLNFIVPSLSYAIAPEIAQQSFLDMGRLFHAAPYPKSEDSYTWRFLAVSNVFTLGTMCFMLHLNLRRFYPILPALFVLKAVTALQFLVHFVFVLPYPAFLLIGIFDGLTCALFLFFAGSARRSLASDGNDGSLVPAPRLRESAR